MVRFHNGFVKGSLLRLCKVKKGSAKVHKGLPEGGIESRAIGGSGSKGFVCAGVL